jgi:hypothetical protein
MPMEINFNSFIEFITDGKRRLSVKAAFIVVAIISVFILDNLIGFSFHYQEQKKIAEIEALNIIIKDHSNDSISITYASTLRDELIERKNLLEKIFLFFKNITSSDDQKQNSSGPTEISKNKSVSIKSIFWTYASSGGIYFILTIVSIPLLFITDKKNKLIVIIGTTITTVASMFIFGMFLTWLFSLIPQISSKTWLWNYLLNFTFQLIILSILLYFAIKKSKLNKVK